MNVPQYDDTNKGRLFKNDRKADNQFAPDYKGVLNVNGEEFQIAGWINETTKDTQFSKKGTKYMRLTVQKKQERADKPPAVEEWIA